MLDNVDLPTAQNNHELVGKNDSKVFMFYGKTYFCIGAWRAQAR